MRTLALLLAGILSVSALAQQASSSAQSTAAVMPVSAETRIAMQQIIGDTLVNGQAYEYDRELSDEIGPRLTGSAGYMKAVAWSEDKMRELGLTNVHTESFRMDTWEPVPGCFGRVTSPTELNLHAYSGGWSPSLPRGGVQANVVQVDSLSNENMEKLGDSLRGKIVMFGPNVFPTGAGAADISEAVERLSSLKPAVLLGGGDPSGAEHQSIIEEAGHLTRVPTVRIGAEDKLLLTRLLQHGPVQLDLQCFSQTRDNVEVPQVIGEIRGSELPDQIVIAGAHLDSWNPGTGAQDNGTGVAEVLDAARALRSLPTPPRRTIRFILFGGEEQGKVGSDDYAVRHRAELSNVDAVLVSDTGAGTAYGWYDMGRNDEKTALEQVGQVLSGLGSGKVSPDTKYIFSTDHAGFAVLGVPTLVLWTDMQDYKAHTAADTFDSVEKPTLLQGDATMAATAYAIANASVPFAPHLTPAGVNLLLQQTGNLDNYKKARARDLIP
jgi:hypothetical protein